MVFVLHSTIIVQCMVIRTRSVEFMPFLLSLFTFLNGAAWFGYAFVGKVDIFITVSVTSRSIINSSSHKRVPLHTFIKHFNISILLDSRLFSRTLIPDQAANTHHPKKNKNKVLSKYYLCSLLLRKSNLHICAYNQRDHKIFHHCHSLISELLLYPLINTI